MSADLLMIIMSSSSWIIFSGMFSGAISVGGDSGIVSSIRSPVVILKLGFTGRPLTLTEPAFMASWSIALLKLLHLS